MWRTGAGIDVGERHNLVFFSFQSPSIGGKFGESFSSERVIPFQFRFSYCSAEGRFYLGHICPVRFQAAWSSSTELLGGVTGKIAVRMPTIRRRNLQSIPN